MKKRKIKLFASVASLAMVVAVMGVGVWAATAQAVKVETEITFQATSIAADVKLQISDNQTDENDANDIVKTAYWNSATAVADPANDLTATNGVQIASFTMQHTSGTSGSKVYLTVADKDGDGFLNKGAQVIYTFTVDVAATSANVLYNISTSLGTATITTEAGTKTLADVFSVTITDSANGTMTTAEGVYSLTNVNKDDEATSAYFTSSATNTITITYEVKEDFAYGFKDLALGDITINLASTADKLAGIPSTKPSLPAAPTV